MTNYFISHVASHQTNDAQGYHDWFEAYTSNDMSHRVGSVHNPPEFAEWRRNQPKARTVIRTGWMEAESPCVACLRYERWLLTKHLAHVT